MLQTSSSVLDIKLVFTTFKLRNLFSVKDSVPRELRSRVIYKFTCACCNACYIGETGRHFSTRVREHLSSDKSSHIFKHLLFPNVKASANVRPVCLEFSRI